MRWHDAALINSELKADLRSLSLDEIMKDDYEFREQIFNNWIGLGLSFPCGLQAISRI